MADSNRNEGIHILDDFVCQARPSGLFSSESDHSAIQGRGENAGIAVQDEPDGRAHTRAEQFASALPSVQVTMTGPSTFEIVLDRDFETYTSAQQEILLTSIRQLLLEASDVRVVRRMSA